MKTMMANVAMSSIEVVASSLSIFIEVRMTNEKPTKLLEALRICVDLVSIILIRAC